MADEKKLLINEHPLIILPTLAHAVGLNEAVILQQIHYWLQIARENGANFKEGHYWTFNSVRQWQRQFPWWSERTIKRILYSLTKQGILIYGCFNKIPIDRTRWYRINYESLESLISSRRGQNGTIEGDKMALCEGANLSPPIPETSVPKTSAETSENTGNFSGTQNSYSTGNSAPRNPSLSFSEFITSYEVNDEVVEAVNYFLSRYREVFKKEHMKLKAATWEKVTDTLFTIYDTNLGRDMDDIGYDSIECMTDHYFKKVMADKYKAKNISITHFNHNGIKTVNFFEDCY